MKKCSFLLYLFGENEFTADLADGARLLNVFMEYGIIYRGFRATDGEKVVFSASSYSSVIITRLCRQKGIKITKTRSRGLPPAIYRYRNRVGIFIGAVIAAVLLSVYDNFIWDITVSGNESVTYSEVVNALSAHGLSVGSTISDLNVDRIKTAVMVDDTRISWMAINVEGTVAHVQVRETKSPSDETPKRPANIVASRDGQIENLEVFKGSAAVVSGQAVRKGDILISGVRDLKNGGFSVTRANGRVFAVTEHSFRVEVPYEYEQKIYEKGRKREISIIFFGKEIKVLKFNGNNGGFCDTIDSVDMLSLPGGVDLPVGIRKLKDIPYTVEKKFYSPEEAMEIAYYRLERMIEAEIPEAGILGKNIKAEIGERSYVLTCTVRCVEDIAETVEFDADLR